MTIISTVNSVSPKLAGGLVSSLPVTLPSAQYRHCRYCAKSVSLPAVSTAYSGSSLDASSVWYLTQAA